MELPKLDSIINPYTIACCIFYDFVVNQSVTITGYIEIKDGRLEKKGEAVLRELEQLDSLMNRVKDGKKNRRKRNKPADSIGGYVAQPIWKYAHKMIDNEPRTTIWRIQ